MLSGDSSAETAGAGHSCSEKKRQKQMHATPVGSFGSGQCQPESTCRSCLSGL
jgi:hypothetical protein